MSALEDLELMTCEDLVNDSVSDTNEPSNDRKQNNKSNLCLSVTKLSVKMKIGDPIPKKDAKHAALKQTL